MNYDELITHLQNNHFYPAKVMRVKNKSKVMEGFQIDSPSLLKDERQKRLEDIVGQDFRVDWMPNESHFIIKKR